MSQLCTSFQADQLNVAGDWEDRFRVEYAALSLKHSKRRRARKSGTRRRVDQEAADHSDELLFRDIAIDRARSRRAAVQMRLEEGLRWWGGSGGWQSTVDAPVIYLSG